MSLNTVKRIGKELRDLHTKPIREFTLVAMENNVLEVHFTMMGPEDSPYANGLYHGRVYIPPEYPFAPPDVALLTPSGRFELNKKVCLSVSSFHPDRWKPSWGIATIIHSLRDFMRAPGHGGVGAVEYSDDKRRELATQSHKYVCPECHAVVAEQWEEMKDAPSTTDKGEMPPPTTPSPPAPPSSTGCEVPPPMGTSTPEVSPSSPDAASATTPERSAHCPAATPTTHTSSSSSSTSVEPAADPNAPSLAASFSPSEDRPEQASEAKVPPDEQSSPAPVDRTATAAPPQSPPSNQSQQRQAAAAASASQAATVVTPPASRRQQPAASLQPRLRREGNNVVLELSIASVDRALHFVLGLIAILLLRKAAVYFVYS